MPLDCARHSGRRTPSPSSGYGGGYVGADLVRARLIDGHPSSKRYRPPIEMGAMEFALRAGPALRSQRWTFRIHVLGMKAAAYRLRLDNVKEECLSSTSPVTNAAAVRPITS
ncbi:unnamed protein product [Lampetra planeri]